ncbi:MAG TPA: T9SS type A sorting domain-containing protein [Bacteroidales bacterium]
MKTIITLIVLIFSINLAISQPVVNSDILLNIGDERRVSYVETAFNPGDAGENVTWDFSNLQQSYEVDWFAIDPVNTGFFNMFPTSDIAFYIPGDENNGWTFYNTGNGEEISLLGAVLLNGSGNDVDTTYFGLDDPDLLFEFPMTYPDQFSDDIEGISVVFYQGQMFELERSGTTTTEVDGYGTLTTPEGTFYDVIRVKRTEDIVDIYLMFVTYQEIVRYDWFSPDYDYLLYHTEEIVIKDASGNEQNRTTQTWYAEPRLITGLSEKKIGNFTVYPNPCKDVLNLPIELVSKSQKIEIINMQGSTIYSNNQKADKIDVSPFKAGVYIVLITGNDGKQYRSQFVIG